MTGTFWRSNFCKNFTRFAIIFWNGSMSHYNKKHGIFIKFHKDWHTKTIWNKGHVMRCYRRCPNNLKFKSIMVNDFNQHLCGGWSFDGISRDEAILSQLINRKKPLGVLCSFHDGKRLDQYYDEAIKNNLVCHGSSRLLGPETTVFDLVICQDAKLIDLFDLEALSQDYIKNVFKDDSKEFKEELDLFSNYELSGFVGGWDSPPLPLWLTGLILGYPVENTISIYLC